MNTLADYLVRLELGQIGLLLEEYRAAHGSYPESLELLGLPEKDLIDPFTGGPFRYQSSEQGVLLYSVGSDRTDDNGQAQSGKNRDLVWRVERPAP